MDETVLKYLFKYLLTKRMKQTARIIYKYIFIHIRLRSMDYTDVQIQYTHVNKLIFVIFYKFNEFKHTFKQLPHDKFMSQK